MKELGEVEDEESITTPYRGRTLSVIERELASAREDLQKEQSIREEAQKSVKELERANRKLQQEVEEERKKEKGYESLREELVAKGEKIAGLELQLRQQYRNRERLESVLKAIQPADGNESEYQKQLLVLKQKLSEEAEQVVTLEVERNQLIEKEKKGFAQLQSIYNLGDPHLMRAYREIVQAEQRESDEVMEERLRLQEERINQLEADLAYRQSMDVRIAETLEKIETAYPGLIAQLNASPGDGENGLDDDGEKYL